MLMLVVLVVVLVVGCGDGDPMKTSYVNDCTAEGYSEKKCVCLFDYGKENLSDEQFMATDLTHDYRNTNNISKPNLSLADEEKMHAVVMESLNKCIE